MQALFSISIAHRDHYGPHYSFHLNKETALNS